MPSFIPNNTGKKYKIRKPDPTAQQPLEPKVVKSFWRDNLVSDIMKLSEAELEEKLNKFFIKYEAKQLKQNPKWWYPEKNVTNTDILRKQKTKYRGKFN